MVESASGPEREPLSSVRTTFAAYSSIAVALLLVVLIGGWGILGALTDVRTSVLLAEAGKLRSHGLHTVGHIETELEGRDDVTLASLREKRRLERFWERTIPRERQRLYAAIVDETGTVVLHSDPTLVGRSVGAKWKQRAVVEAGEDVFETESPALSDGVPAIDIRIPIVVDDLQVGDYHSGLDREWFDREVKAQQFHMMRRWAIIVGLIAVVVLLAAWLLYHINRRTVALQQTLSLARVKQLSDLGRLVGGLAHEIRNPLNAIRLNLHAIERVIEGRGRLEPEEMQRTVEESIREIARLEELMKTLLGYARPDQSVDEDVDLTSELESMSSFLTPVMERDEIEFDVTVPDHRVVARIDRDRLRQIMLNLLNNAKEAAGKRGRVNVRLADQGETAHITVADSGPGIPKADREKVFEPFYSTKDTGTGLGLALVKTFVKEAGGTAVCEASGTGGALFRIVLPQQRGGESTNPQRS